MNTKNTFPPPKRDVKPPFSYRESLYNGALMGIGISTIWYAARCCLGEKYGIKTNTNQTLVLVGLIIASRFGIDALKREKIITKEW